MTDLRNKVIFITGASSGIGAGTAVEFARLGSKLALTGRDLNNLQKTADQCIEFGLSSNDIFLDTGDVTNIDDVSRIVKGAVEKFGRIDVLVNNAGSCVDGLFQEATIKHFDDMYNSNMRSVLIVTKIVLPHIIKTKGSIVNVSSIAGSRPIIYCFAYGMAKAALNYFTQTLALEVAGQGVRVNSVNPAIIKTPIFTRPGGRMAKKPEQIDQYYKQMAELHPLKIVGEAQDVASSIVFLSSGSAAFITGAIFPIDGGRSLAVSSPAKL